MPRQTSTTSLLAALAPRSGFLPRARLSSAMRQPSIEEGSPNRQTARREGLYRRLLACGDAIATGVALQTVVGVTAGVVVNPGAVLALVMIVLINKLSGLYDRDEIVLKRSTLDEVPKLFQISGLFALGAWLLHGVVTVAFLHQTDILALWGLTFALLVLARAGARAAARRWTASERCLVIGEPALAERVRIKMRDSHVKAEVVGSIPMPAEVSTDNLIAQNAFSEIATGLAVQRVIIAPEGTTSIPTLEMVRMAKAAGLRVSLMPRLFEVVGSSVEFDELDGLTMLGIRRFGLSRSSLAIKRTFDVLGAGIGLVAIAPLFALIALAIRLDGRGSVFFRQTRVGRDGERFQMVKFRTMVPDAEALKMDLQHRNEGARGFFKIADDPRITRVGKLLRRTSLDELPQLLNVLWGEMSLVGPRPLIEEEDSLIRGYDRSRLHLVPGMTGHWQILGSARIPMDEMITIDYLYVANWSLWIDLKILIRTVAHVLSRTGV